MPLFRRQLDDEADEPPPGDYGRAERLKRDLRRDLLESQTANNFGTWNTYSQFANPGLQINAVSNRPLSLPLTGAESDLLLAHAMQRSDAEELASAVAFGDGEFTILNSAWNQYFQNVLLQDVATGLGLDIRALRSECSRVLLETGRTTYEGRSDTTDESMYGRLAVFLPSTYEGGEMMLSDGKTNLPLPLPSPERSQFDLSVFAWRADAECQSTDITSGSRLILEYQLFHENGTQTRQRPDAIGLRGSTVRSRLRSWLTDHLETIGPMLVYPLPRTKTEVFRPSTLTLDDLADDDKAVVRLLDSVCAKEGIYPFLATLQLHWRNVFTNILELSNIIDLNDRSFGSSVKLSCSGGKLDRCILSPDIYVDRAPDMDIVTQHFVNTAVVLVPKLHLAEVFGRSVTLWQFPTYAHEDCIDNLLDLALKELAAQPSPDAQHDATQLLASVVKSHIFEEAVHGRVLRRKAVTASFHLGVLMRHDFDSFVLTVVAALKCSPETDGALELDVLQHLADEIQKRFHGRDLADTPDIWDLTFSRILLLCENTSAVGLSLARLARSLVRCEVGALASFRSYLSITVKRIFLELQVLDDAHVDLFLHVIHPHVNDVAILKQEILPHVGKHATRSFLLRILPHISQPVFGFPQTFFKDVVPSILAADECHGQIRLSVEDVVQEASDSWAPIFHNILRTALDADLDLVVSNIAIMSADAVSTTEEHVRQITSVPKHDSVEAAHTIISCINGLYAMFRQHCESKPSIEPAARRLMLALLRLATMLMGLRPMAAQQWARLPHGCKKCTDCRILDDFLIDPASETWDFDISKTRRGHLRAVLAFSLLSCEDAPPLTKAGVPRKNGKMVLRVTKNAQGEDEVRLKRWKDEINLLRERSASWRTPFLESLLGKKDYKKYVLLQDLFKIQTDHLLPAPDGTIALPQETAVSVTAGVPSRGRASRLVANLGARGLLTVPDHITIEGSASPDPASPDSTLISLEDSPAEHGGSTPISVTNTPVLEPARNNPGRNRITAPAAGAKRKAAIPLPAPQARKTQRPKRNAGAPHATSLPGATAEGDQLHEANAESFTLVKTEEGRDEAARTRLSSILSFDDWQS